MKIPHLKETAYLLVNSYYNNIFLFISMHTYFILHASNKEISIYFGVSVVNLIINLHNDQF